MKSYCMSNVFKRNKMLLNIGEYFGVLEDIKVRIKTAQHKFFPEACRLWIRLETPRRSERSDRIRLERA